MGLVIGLRSVMALQPAGRDAVVAKRTRRLFFVNPLTMFWWGQRTLTL